MNAACTVTLIKYGCSAPYVVLTNTNTRTAVLHKKILGIQTSSCENFSQGDMRSKMVEESGWKRGLIVASRLYSVHSYFLVSKDGLGKVC